MRVSLILPCRNEAAYIGRCLDSLLETEYPLDQLEILVVDGASDDDSRAIAATYAAKHGVVRLLDNPRRSAPAALNVGIAAATGDVIMRVDAHARYPAGYVPCLVNALIETGADNVGGPIVTVPGGTGAIARAVALALGHPFGVGNSWFRIGTNRPRWVDTVPYGCYRRAVFERLGTFDEELVRNQDDEFNARLVRAGGRILLVPQARSYYYARGSARLLGRMLYWYGFFKPLAARKVGAVTTFRQLVPAAFVLVVGIGGLLAPFDSIAAFGWAAVCLSYAGAVAIAAGSTIRRQGARVALLLAAMFPVMHVAYGLGYLSGLGPALTRSRIPRSQQRAVPIVR